MFLLLADKRSFRFLPLKTPGKGAIRHMAWGFSLAWRPKKASSLSEARPYLTFLLVRWNPFLRPVLLVSQKGFSIICHYPAGAARAVFSRAAPLNRGGMIMSRISNILTHRSILISGLFLAALGGAAIAQQNKDTVQVPDGGLALSEFKGYETWQVVSVSQHPGIIDVILGNPTTIAAYKAGIPANGKPFPDGSRMVKIHWNSKKYSDAFPVQAPDTLHDIDTMVRDSKRFTGADHWGFSQFNYDTASQTFSPLGKGPNCGTACHQAAAARDFVFTEFPTR